MVNGRKNWYGLEKWWIYEREGTHGINERDKKSTLEKGVLQQVPNCLKQYMYGAFQQGVREDFTETTDCEEVCLKGDTTMNWMCGCVDRKVYEGLSGWVYWQDSGSLTL